MILMSRKYLLIFSYLLFNNLVSCQTPYQCGRNVKRSEQSPLSEHYKNYFSCSNDASICGTTDYELENYNSPVLATFDHWNVNQYSFCYYTLEADSPQVEEMKMEIGEIKDAYLYLYHKSAYNSYTYLQQASQNMNYTLDVKNNEAIVVLALFDLPSYSYSSSEFSINSSLIEPLIVHNTNSSIQNVTSGSNSSTESKNSGSPLFIILCVIITIGVYLLFIVLLICCKGCCSDHKQKSLKIQAKMVQSFHQIYVCNPPAVKNSKKEHDLDLDSNCASTPKRVYKPVQNRVKKIPHSVGIPIRGSIINHEVMEGLPIRPDEESRELVLPPIERRPRL